MDESEIITLIEKYRSLQLSKIIDFDKFNHYALTHHSTSIEGSTLTETETRLLLDEGLTPKGKPIIESLMVIDHFDALQFIIESAREKKKITPEFIQQINAKVLRPTGSLFQTVFGELDSSKGVFRKGNVSAGSSYFVNYDKIELLLNKLCEEIQKKVSREETIVEKLNSSFDAHFDLVTIHPFYDGNGRTSRLLMNYLQLILNLPMAIVFKEDKVAYFDALIETRKKEKMEIFRKFMYNQYGKYLLEEVNKAEDLNNSTSSGKGFSFVF